MVGAKMPLGWGDIEELAQMLSKTSPNMSKIEVETLRFKDLRLMISSLEGFSEPHDSFNERRLEAVQQAWLEEF